jgi:hypothetical protein
MQLDRTNRKALQRALRRLVEMTEQHRRARRRVDRFASSHPRFDEIADLIERELKRGYDLSAAYKRAEKIADVQHENRQPG